MNVIYCRSAQQSIKGIERQKQLCGEFLELQGIKVDKIYVDDGFSGMNDDNPSLSKIVEELDNIESIAVVGVDRISRDSLKLLKFYQLLKSKNIKLYDAGLGFDIIESYDFSTLKDLLK